MWGNFWWIWTTFYSLQLIILKNLFINQRDKLLGFSFLQIFMVFERHWGIWRFWTQVHRVKVIIRACHLGHSGHLPDISYRYQVSVYASFMSSRYESSKFTSGQRISMNVSDEALNGRLNCMSRILKPMWEVFRVGTLPERSEGK